MVDNFIAIYIRLCIFELVIKRSQEVEESSYITELCILLKKEIARNKEMMKPGKNDVKAYIKFETEELELLQENTWQMAESFGLDRRIDNLTGSRKVGFYSWDLDCLESVVSDLTGTPVGEKLYEKIRKGMDFIQSHRNKR
ncbi:MAG: hypothetical protein IPL46_00865 [Saprospiraceae bacterium]|nr:hypothetical protein [Saprospiraceae bacterium]